MNGRAPDSDPLAHGLLGDSQGERSGRWVDALLTVLVFGIALAFFSLSYDRSFELSDEGLILYHSARTANGEIPYRDFPDVYGPGVLVVTGVVLRAFGGDILPVRILLACLKALATAATFLICRTVVPRWFALLGAVVGTAYWGRLAWNLNTPYAALYTIPLCMVACLVLIHGLRSRSSVPFAIAGLLSGVSILFKQTLGVMNTVGMALALCAVAALHSPPAERSRAGTRQFLLVWLLGGLAFLMPASRYLRPSDYVLHFLPLHLFVATVAVAVVTRGGSAPLLPMIGRHLAALLAGAALPPALTALFYAWIGALDALVFNMVGLPSSLVNYYLAVPVPAAGRLMLLGSIVALISAGFLMLRGRRPAGRRIVVVALLLWLGAVVSQPRDVLSGLLGHDDRWPTYSEWPAIVWAVPLVMEGALPGLLVVAAATTIAPLLFRGSGPVGSRFVATMVPVVLLQSALVYQIFPRASFNVWLLQGATVPLLTLVLYRWYRLSFFATASALRRIGAVLLIVVVPFWLVGPIFQHLLRESTRPRFPLPFPEARHIRPSGRDLYLGHVGELERLVSFLKGAEPSDGPVLPISTEMMMLYLSKRPHLFPKLDYYFFLLSIDMLPPSDSARLASDESLVRRLSEAPEALVVIRRGQSESRMLGALVRLRDAIQRDYVPVAEIGDYVVLRRQELEARSRAVAQ